LERARRPRFIFSPIRNVTLEGLNPLPFWLRFIDRKSEVTPDRELRIKPNRNRERVKIMHLPESLFPDAVLCLGAVEVARLTQWRRPTIRGPLATSCVSFTVGERPHPNMRRLDRRRRPANAAALPTDKGEERLVLDAGIALA
jgi:hypothetical protein